MTVLAIAWIGRPCAAARARLAGWAARLPEVLARMAARRRKQRQDRLELARMSPYQRCDLGLPLD